MGHFDKRKLVSLQKSFDDDVAALNGVLEDFDRTRRLCIRELRGAADYLDSVWFGCRIGRSVGTGFSIVGGVLSIAGGIAALATAGAALPLLISGLSISGAGGAANISSSFVEEVIQSEELKKFQRVLKEDQLVAARVKTRIDRLRRYKDLFHLLKLDVVLEFKFSGVIQFILQSVMTVGGGKSQSGDIVGIGTVVAAIKGLNGMLRTMISQSKTVGIISQAAAGAFIGLNVVLVAFDAVDFGMTVDDLVIKKGSEAAKVLREMAFELEEKLWEDLNQLLGIIPQMNKCSRRPTRPAEKRL